MTLSWRRGAQTVAQQTWERRGAYRAPVSFETAFHCQGVDERYEGKVVDFSASGLRLTSEVELPPGSHIELEVEFPNAFLKELNHPEERRLWSIHFQRAELPFPKLQLRGIAVSAGFDGRTRQHVYGVNFVGLSASTQEELYRFVNLWQRYRLQVTRYRSTLL
jgi:c-di-GMP-binding flagellar brake protein YcgR